jgi:hypothetical protein
MMSWEIPEIDACLDQSTPEITVFRMSARTAYSRYLCIYVSMRWANGNPDTKGTVASGAVTRDVCAAHGQTHCLPYLLHVLIS